MKNTKKQVLFIQLSFRIVFLFCFVRKRLIHFLCGLLLLCYFAPVRKRSNSRSQMFYKIDALKNLAVFPGKHYKLYYNKLYKKILQHRFIPVNIAKCLSTAFFIEHLLFIILFQNFMLWQNYLGVFGCKIDICHISCTITLFSVIILALESEVHCYFVCILILYQAFQ